MAKKKALVTLQLPVYNEADWDLIMAACRKDDLTGEELLWKALKEYCEKRGM